jgi:hypothetical protein
VSRHIVICIISQGGVRLAKRPTARGGFGAWLRHWVDHEGRQCTHAEGSGEQRLGFSPGICFPLPENPNPTYVHPPAMTVASRPPTGRVLGVTVMCPSPSSAPLAVCRSQWGEARGGPSVRICQRGSSRVRRVRGGHDGPGSRQRPRELGGVEGSPDLRGTGWSSPPGFSRSLVRENHPTSKGSGGLYRLPSGSRDSKS